MNPKPDRCPACHGGDLAHGSLEALFKLGFFHGVATQAAACLACGHLTPYLDPAALDTLRRWNQDAAPAKAVADER